MDFSTTALSVLSLCLMALPGFILIKLKMLKAEYIAVLAIVLLYVNQPFITLNAFLSKTYEQSLLANMGIVLAFGVFSQIIVLFIAKIIFTLDKKNRPRANAYAYASAIGNAGFMGIPVVAVLLPNNAEAILYVSIFLVSFNLVCWTLGVYVLTGDKKYISLKKAILNPPIIAMIIALPIFFLKVKMPSFLMQPINFIAEMNTPLAMIILGMRFATIRFRELFLGIGMYVSSFIKLIFTPLLVYVCMLPFNLSTTLTQVLLILSAMPAANMVLIMAEKFEGDTTSATKAVLNSTFLCIITVPLILLLPI